MNKAITKEFEINSGIHVCLDTAVYVERMTTIRYTINAENPQKGSYVYPNDWIGEGIYINIDMESHPEYLRVLFHEMAHATMFRVGRNVSPYNEEIVAESTGLMLLEYFGLNTPELTKICHDYIDKYEQVTWLEGSCNAHALSDQAFRYIIENWIPEAASFKEAAWLTKSLG